MKRRQQCFYGLRLRQQTNGDLGHNGERSFGADNNTDKIHADHFARRVAQANDLACRRDRLDGQNVIRRHSILQAMRST